eukprot:TRINITY_DN3942_c2_g1_i1.p1 TRINITY_DN3942_c2_g1~~TRINITY_DN3942_c2_g1_i1.p1  ORF type:complete len:482 (+),score=63.48 TRINITY_DN3942_c2_g1_i1:45-1490(+)
MGFACRGNTFRVFQMHPGPWSRRKQCKSYRRGVESVGMSMLALLGACSLFVCFWNFSVPHTFLVRALWPSLGREVRQGLGWHRSGVGAKPEDVAEPQDEALDVLEWSALPRLKASDALAQKLERTSVQVSGRGLDVGAITSRVHAALQDLGMKVAAGELEKYSPNEESFFEPSELADVAAAFRQLSRSQDGLEDPRTPDLFATAAELLQQPECDPEPVASLLRLWSRFKSQEVGYFLHAFHHSLPKAARSMNIHNLTSCFHSIVKLQRVVPEASELVLGVIDAIPGRAAEMLPEHVCEILYWGSALDLGRDQLAMVVAPLLRGLTLEDLETLSLLQLGRLAWGMARLNQKDKFLLRGITTIVLERASKSHKKEALEHLPMVVLAVSMLGFKEPLMFQMLNAVAERLQQRQMMKKLTDWRLCALASAWPQDGVVHTFPQQPNVKIKLKDMWVYLTPLLKKRGIVKEQIKKCTLGPELWETSS